jgi:probable HAF family extracellular repeat protein
VRALTFSTRACVLALSITAPGFAGAATEGPRYEVVDLGVIQPLAVDVTPGLSRSGNIVTWHQGEAQTFSGLLRAGTTERALTPPPGYQNSFAYSVNDRGNAVGWSNTTANPVDSASVVHATYFGRRGPVDLGTLGGRRSRAYAINDRDVVVGVSELADGTQRAFRYAGRMEPLDTLTGGTYSIAFDINNPGLIAGASALPSTSTRPQVHAVLWLKGVPQDLGALEQEGNSIAYAVNDRGDVTGVSDRDGEETVFLYQQGKMLDLHIDGHAFAINNARDIVGTLTPPERGRPRGFLWRDGVLRDLDTLLVTDTYRIEVAYRINDRGQILCSGVSQPEMGQGSLHALLLNPIDRGRGLRQSANRPRSN